LKNKEKYDIEKIYPISDQKYFLVNLKENYWQIKGEKDASIIFKDEVIVLRYVGFSNINGKLVLKLIPRVGELEKFNNVLKKLEGEIEGLYLEI